MIRIKRSSSPFTNVSVYGQIVAEVKGFGKKKTLLKNITLLFLELFL